MFYNIILKQKHYKVLSNDFCIPYLRISYFYFFMRYLLYALIMVKEKK